MQFVAGLGDCSFGRTTLNHSTNGEVVDSPGKKQTRVRHFESLGKFVSHESGIL